MAFDSAAKSAAVNQRVLERPMTPLSRAVTSTFLACNTHMASPEAS